MSLRRTSYSSGLVPRLAVMLLGAALRVAPLTDNRLHPDEALFGALARQIVSGQDILLANTSLLVDKPPLLYYTLAAGVSISWASELALRAPGLFASLISLALVGRLGRLLWRSNEASLASMLVAALSPFAISFAPTAFADPQMVMWLLASTTFAASDRWEWGGFCFGLAFASKQNAVFFVPLVIAIGVDQCAVRSTDWRDGLRWVVRFAVGVVVVLVFLVLWDSVRQAEFSTWQAAIAANNPQRLIRSGELLSRLGAWWQWMSIFTGSALTTTAVLFTIFVTVICDLRNRRPDRRSIATLILVVFSIGYSAMLWLVAFPVLDRYLLGLVPVFALLIGRSLQLATTYFAQRTSGISDGAKFRVAIQRLLSVLLSVLLLGPAIRAARSGYPVGGDHGAYDGIDAVSAYIRTLPDGSIVYYDSLGWTLAYYLFDSYVVPVSISSPAGLADDLTVYGAGPEERYLLLPAWASQQRLLDATARAGFASSVVIETENRYGEPTFVLYHLSRSDSSCPDCRSE